MTVAQIWPALAVIVTFGISLAHVIFRTGHLTARVEALEKWRESVRTDLHEISDKLELMVGELRMLHTLIEERTDRRVIKRD